MKGEVEESIKEQGYRKEGWNNSSIGWTPALNAADLCSSLDLIPGTMSPQPGVVP